MDGKLVSAATIRGSFDKRREQCFSDVGYQSSVRDAALGQIGFSFPTRIHPTVCII